MKAFIKRMITTVGLLTLIAAPSSIMVTSIANAQSGSQCSGSSGTIASCVCNGLTKTQDASDQGCTDDGSSSNSFAGLSKKIINIFSIVVGTVSVVMIIIGGFRYIISGGDSNGVQGAKNTIMYAIIGLVIVLFAQIIVRFVLSNAASQS